jgi:DNA-binding MarR family transcriptional regulator
MRADAKRSRGQGRPVRAQSPRGAARSTPALPVLQALQGFRLIFGSARRYDASVRRYSGIPGSLLWALSEVDRAGGMSVNGLAECMALHQTTASNLVNALVRRDLIRRVKDPRDRRMVRLHVSGRGRRALLHAPRPHTGLLMDALSRLDTKHLDLLLVGLSGLVAELRRADVKAAGKTLLGE